MIIAARPDDRDIAALASLDAWRRPGVVEIIVARGRSPASQRNTAARQAVGEVLLFLDDDSAPSSDLIDIYATAFSKDEALAACGGPAIYRGDGLIERVAAAVLSAPLVTGRSASRYASRGARRRSDERQLILSNLAVRRSVFERVGRFDEVLYPNEENALLDRFRDEGEAIVYEPTAIVTRPSPRTLSELLGKVFTYGRGRAAQARKRLTMATTFRVVAAIAVIACVIVALVTLPWAAWPLATLGAIGAFYAASIAVTTSTQACIGVALLAGPLALLTQLSYAAGIVWGLLVQLPVRLEDVMIERHAPRSPRA